jgi:tetratricopeptide (TPR) repeat protein
MSASGHNVDGVRNVQFGNYQAAIQDFQQALLADPNNADAYYNLAAIYHELGRKNSDQNLLQQAEGLYHQCLDRNSDHAECHRGLAVLLVQTDRAESAFTLLERWATRSQRLADPRIELARLYEEFGDQDSATRHLTDALDAEPHNARAWTALANLREKRGELAQALSNYQHAYNLNRLQPGVAHRIAQLQRNLSLEGESSSQNGSRIVSSPSDTTR